MEEVRDPDKDVDIENDQQTGSLRLRVYAPPETILQVLQNDRVPLNIVLPGMMGRGDAHVMLSAQPNGEMLVDIDLDNRMADTLLRFLTHGMVCQANSMIEIGSTDLLSEDLLRGKMADPIAACVGAYTLLRLGDLDKLHDWTRNLMNWFDWLPDGAALRAEHAARLGEHYEAIDAIAQMCQRGLPFFADGLSYAASRARTYAQVEGDRRFRGADYFVGLLSPFLANVSTQSPTLIYTGVEPNFPDRERLGSSLKRFEGLDVSDFFRSGGIESAA